MALISLPHMKDAESDQVPLGHRPLAGHLSTLPVIFVPSQEAGSRS